MSRSPPDVRFHESVRLEVAEDGEREARGREERLRGRGQLRGWTATPRDLIRAMPAKGDRPAGRFLCPGWRGCSM